MPCCPHTRHQIIRQWKIPREDRVDLIARRRECLDCWWHWNTYEIEEDLVKDIVDEIKKIAKQHRREEKKLRALESE